MPERLGDAPIEPAYFDHMNAVAEGLDKIFNGDVKGKDRDIGFVLLVFRYGEKEGRCNFISNGADRREIVVMFKEMISRFEGQAEMKGTA